VIATALGRVLARARGIGVDEGKALALGLQWLFNPILRRLAPRLSELIAAISM